MANSMLGGQPHEYPQEWSTFEFDVDQAQLANELYHNTLPMQSLSHQGFDAYNPDAQPTLHKTQLHAFPRQTPAKNRASNELADPVPNGPLTQQQKAALEDQYQTTPRPKPEARRSLSEKLGIDLNKVNHWYQNRRQRTRSHKKSGKGEVDSAVSGAQNTGLSFPLSISHSGQPTSFQQGTELSSDQMRNAPPNGLEINSSAAYAESLRQLSENTQAYAKNDNQGLSACFGGSSPGNHWDHDHTVTLHDALLDPNYQQAVSSSLIGQSVPSHMAYHLGSSVHQSADLLDPSHGIHRSLSHSLHGNMSTQTLDSSYSSIGDGSAVFTPPSSSTPPNPPMPWLTSEFDSRRTSDSSELASNVDAMHIRQSQPSLSLATSSIGPSPHSSRVSLTGATTPDASPDHGPGKAYGRSSSLATRRKGMQPASLRPEANRSTSHNDPLTRSPHSRTSSISQGPGLPRRAQSSGQVLHQFRVQKPGNAPAQVSPRNLQTHFDKQSVSQSRQKPGSKSATASPTTPHHASNKPSASAAVASRSPAEYQHEFSVQTVSQAQNQTTHFTAPLHGNNSVPNLHAASGHFHARPSLQIPGHQQIQWVGHGTSPSSAPPQQTTFPDFVFANVPGHVQVPDTAMHHYSHTNEMNMTAVTGHAMGTFAQNMPQQYLPPFAPAYTFIEGSDAMGYPHPTLMPNLAPGILALPAAPPQELDIKLEVGPEPMLSQRFDRCEFQNTFSDKWGQSDGKK